MILLQTIAKWRSIKLVAIFFCTTLYYDEPQKWLNFWWHPTLIFDLEPLTTLPTSHSTHGMQLNKFWKFIRRKPELLINQNCQRSRRSVRREENQTVEMEAECPEWVGNSAALILSHESIVDVQCNHLLGLQSTVKQCRTHSWVYSTTYKHLHHQQQLSSVI